MLDLGELEKGKIIRFRGNLYKILDSKHLHLGRGGAMLQAKLKDLKSGSILDYTFKPADSSNIEEVEFEKKKIKFIFAHRQNYNFLLLEGENKRFQISEERLEDKKFFLKPGEEYESLWLEDEFLDILLPPKVDLKVIEAPPNFKGDTAQGGSKEVTLETGLKIKVPMFVKEGDLVRVNTETKEYSGRVS